MDLKKKELIISLVMVIAFIIIGLTMSSFATQNFEYPSSNTNTSGNNSTLIEVRTSNNTSNTRTNTTTVNNTINSNTSTNRTNTNTNTSSMPNTGVENLPWAVIAICGISAIFAYKKIKEYKVD